MVNHAVAGIAAFIVGSATLLATAEGHPLEVNNTAARRAPRRNAFDAPHAPHAPHAPRRPMLLMLRTFSCSGRA